MKPLVIIGAGGHAREIADLISDINAAERQYDFLGFVVDSKYGKAGDLVHGTPIVGDFAWLGGQTNLSVFCGIGYSHRRRSVIERLQDYALDFCSLVHPQAVVSRTLKMGVGTLITAGCVLTTDIQLGDHVHINRNSTVGHDCVLGDFVTVSPGVNVSGNVTIETGCFIGTGATIIEKKTIGGWSTVGAGSTVIHDVPRNATVVGTPSKVIKQRAPGWYFHENN